MSTPIDINRLKIKIKLSPSIMGQRSWSAELYQDSTDYPPITDDNAIKSELFADPNSHTEEAGLKLATAYLCNGAYAQYIWSIPTECSDRTWLAKNFVKVVVPPKPTPLPTPEPTPIPTNSVESVADLPPVDNPTLIEKQTEARQHTDEVKTKQTEQAKKSFKLELLKGSLKFAAQNLASSAISKALGSSNQVGARNLTGIASLVAGTAVESIFAKISASNAQSASLSEALSVSIDNESITNSIDANLAQFTGSVGGI